MSSAPASASISENRDMKRKFVRILAGAALSVIVLLAVGWIAFVPSNREPPYKFVVAWGTKGSSPGAFNDPTGVAVAANEVYVADSRNGRIQVFDMAGNFRRAFGRPGKAYGELGRPMNLTAHNGELYVPEYFNDRVQIFALDGTPKRIIGTPGSGAGQFDAPGGVAVGADGSLVVADFYNQRIQQLTAGGTPVRQWGTTREIGVSAGQFNYPTDVAIGRDGVIFVADGYGDRVQAFKADGAFSHKWGGPFAMNIFGPFNGWFAVATGIAVGPEGNVFVADFYNHRIQKFAPDGTFLTSFGKSGAGPGEFEHPIAVDVAADGTVFVADFGNNRIQKWRRP
tara:strand:- start:459 stop:1478 length:1020 start_codon:yes stop_codon:yes gene_type:complete